MAMATAAEMGEDALAVAAVAAARSRPSFLPAGHNTPVCQLPASLLPSWHSKAGPQRYCYRLQMLARLQSS